MASVDLCAEEEVAKVGAFATGRLGEVPVIAIRGWCGTLRAFINLCRHQNVQLEWDARGVSDGVFTCPFHGWTYGLEGECLSPAFDDTCNLPPLRCHITDGRVIVSDG